MSTNTYTHTYTKPRIDVVEDHFTFFFACAGLNKADIKKHLDSIRSNELQAVGVYLEKDGFMIAEVELDVDWNVHHDAIRVSGNMFDTNRGGWKNGVAPEAYILVQGLVDEANRLGLEIRHWIRVTQAVRNDSNKHKMVCDNLGYSFGSSVAKWKKPPAAVSRGINYLPEATVTTRKQGQY
jgi:hypothetical protein